MSSQSFHRLGIILLVVLLIASFGSACASKKFVREEVQASTRTLSTRIDNTEGSIRENAEQIQGNANQIAELSSLNKQNTRNLETLKGDVRQADNKAGAARTAANRAQQSADDAKTIAGSLDAKFTNRNNYSVLAEKIIYFKFNSAQLDDSYQADLIEVAAVLKKNPDAQVILEGRTDQAGDPDYNVRLGERRLDSVLRYLVVDQAVPIHRIHKMSFGEAQPLADNESKDGRAKNRCTVIRVLAPSA